MPHVDVIFEGKLLFSYPISMGSINGPNPVEADYVRQAKRCALDDRLLTEKQLETAQFRIRE